MLLQDKILLIVSVALGISEALSLIPFIKANGIFQFVFNILKSLSGKKDATVLELKK